jgi:hypothetical protein
MADLVVGSMAWRLCEEGEREREMMKGTAQLEESVW